MITTAASLNMYHVRGTILNDALEFTYFNLHNNAIRRYHYALLTDKEMEAKRRQAICPGSQSSERRSQDFHLGSLARVQVGAPPPNGTPLPNFFFRDDFFTLSLAC